MLVHQKGHISKSLSVPAAYREAKYFCPVFSSLILGKFAFCKNVRFFRLTFLTMNLEYNAVFLEIIFTEHVCVAVKNNACTIMLKVVLFRNLCFSKIRTDLHLDLFLIFVSDCGS